MLKDKKFLILIGLIILLPLLTIILTSVLKSCQNRGTVYNVYEKKMIVAAEKYFRNNKLELKVEGKALRVSLTTLVSNGYIKSTSSSLKDDTCTGSVIARMNGSSLEKNNGGFINYLVDLSCKNYKTNTLINSLKEKVNDSKSGLYKVGNEYIFKGKNVKNYITFYDKTYRIMGVNSDGFVKLIKTESEPISRMWDNKYNKEIKQPYGKSIYSDSLILSYLTDDYFNEKKIKKDVRKHIVATDTCIGKRAKTDTSISKELDCGELLTNQFLSLMTVSDYALASADPDCKNTTDRTCNNYNYLRDVAPSTWTTNAITEDTYEVFTIVGGVTMLENASAYNDYNIVFYIDGNESIKSGNGTLEDPYIIK